MLNRLMLTGVAALGSVAVAGWVTVTNVNGQETKPPSVLAESRWSVPMPNVQTPTAGGRQLWSDYRVRPDWAAGPSAAYRVQFNRMTGHWRLIDPSDKRLAWGTKVDCTEALDRVRPWRDDDATDRSVTVCLHGLMRSRHCMNKIAGSIRSAGGYPIAVGYASTRATVPDHAESLDEVISDWPEAWRLRFVGHSMGNIVTRCWVGDRRADDAGILGRCESMVMLGPPNQGSSIAKKLRRTGVFGWVAGSGGLNMAAPDDGEVDRTFESIADRLATPPFPFAIIAGDLSHWIAGNPLLDGPNDLVVTVEETKLAGATRFETVPVAHALMMRDDDTIKMTLEMLDQLAVIKALASSDE